MNHHRLLFDTWMAIHGSTLFIGGVPIETLISSGFPIATFDYRRGTAPPLEPPVFSMTPSPEKRRSQTTAQIVSGWWFQSL